MFWGKFIVNIILEVVQYLQKHVRNNFSFKLCKEQWSSMDATAQWNSKAANETAAVDTPLTDETSFKNWTAYECQWNRHRSLTSNRICFTAKKSQKGLTIIRPKIISVLLLPECLPSFSSYDKKRQFLNLKKKNHYSTICCKHTYYFKTLSWIKLMSVKSS